MGAFGVEEAIELDNSIGEVWDFLMSNDEWRRPFVKSVRSLSDGDMAVGHRYENELAMGPITYTAINEIVDLDPPHRLTWRQVNTTPITTTEGNYLLETRDGGTRFTLRNSYETHGWTAPPAPLAKWLTERFIAPRLFRRLRELLTDAYS